MALALGILVVAGLVGLAVFLLRGRRRSKEFENRSITPEELHARLGDEPEVLVYDVRLPLDFLADAEIIPGARRVPPKDIQANTALIPKDRDVVVYCTCPSDATAKMISEKARELEFTRVKFLRGGLGGWKERGFPVEAYTEPFHLDTAT